MNKAERNDELRPEYTREDLGKGVRGKYHEAYESTNNLVLLDPEVAKAFPDDTSVNQALKLLIKAGQTSMGHGKASSASS